MQISDSTPVQESMRDSVLPMDRATQGQMEVLPKKEEGPTGSEESLVVTE